MSGVPRDPVLHDAKAVRQLSGVSGTLVVLMTKDERHWFVRKAAKTVDGSARLRRQVAKQEAFAREVKGLIRTPRIVDSGEVDGRFYFDMEFVRGHDGLTYLRHASYAEVIAFADRLCEYVARAAAAPPVSASVAPTFFDAAYGKICDVSRGTSRLASDVAGHLLLALERVRQLDGLRPTLCHGDLTFENVVVAHDGEITALDLLDSPFEHYWQDVAKLHQDLAGGWYLRRYPPVAECLLDYLRRRLMETATKLNPRYAEAHAVLLATTFVRILPYLEADEDVRFVQLRIAHFARMAST